MSEENTPLPQSVDLKAAIAKYLPGLATTIDDELGILFSSKPSEVDDLTEINGIGPVNAKALNNMGIYRFSQIASWSAGVAETIGERLEFPGRIEREDWVPQAQALAKPASGGAAIARSKRPELSDYDRLHNVFRDEPTKLDQDLGYIYTEKYHADDLTRIKGVGPVIVEKLNDAGIYRFKQIANWNQYNVEEFNERLDFPGRIEREEWIPQARLLMREDDAKRASTGAVAGAAAGVGAAAAAAGIVAGKGGGEDEAAKKAAAEAAAKKAAEEKAEADRLAAEKAAAEKAAAEKAEADRIAAEKAAAEKAEADRIAAEKAAADKAAAEKAEADRIAAEKAAAEKAEADRLAAEKAAEEKAAAEKAEADRIAAEKAAADKAAAEKAEADRIAAEKAAEEKAAAEKAEADRIAAEKAAADKAAAEKAAADKAAADKAAAEKAEADRIAAEKAAADKAAAEKAEADRIAAEKAAADKAAAEKAAADKAAAEKAEADRIAAEKAAAEKAAAAKLDDATAALDDETSSLDDETTSLDGPGSIGGKVAGATAAVGAAAAGIFAAKGGDGDTVPIPDEDTVPLEDDTTALTPLKPTPVPVAKQSKPKSDTDKINIGKSDTGQIPVEDELFKAQTIPINIDEPKGATAKLMEADTTPIDDDTSPIEATLATQKSETSKINISEFEPDDAIFKSSTMPMGDLLDDPKSATAQLQDADTVPMDEEPAEAGSIGIVPLAGTQDLGKSTTMAIGDVADAPAAAGKPKMKRPSQLKPKSIKRPATIKTPAAKEASGIADAPKTVKLKRPGAASADAGAPKTVKLKKAPGGPAKTADSDSTKKTVKLKSRPAPSGGLKLNKGSAEGDTEEGGKGKKKGKKKRKKARRTMGPFWMIVSLLTLFAAIGGLITYLNSAYPNDVTWPLDGVDASVKFNPLPFPSEDKTYRAPMPPRSAPDPEPIIPILTPDPEPAVPGDGTVEDPVTDGTAEPEAVN